MKDFYSKYLLKNLWFHLLTIFSVALIIASFIVPPTGIIDPSVLASVGEVFAFAALGAVIKAIDKGTGAKINKGNVTLEIQEKDDSDSSKS